MPGLDILTFGCRLNIVESEVMRELARASGLEDAVLVNSCAVTAEAERQTRQAIRRAGRERPGVPIIVAGCAAQLRPELYARLPGVTRVLGNVEKLSPSAWASPEPVAVGDIMTVTATAPHLVEGFAENTRGFVEVQQGCDHRCTFCVIPLARGNSRSVPVGGVVEAVRRLVETGHREIVLTGVDLTSYGADLPGQPPLGQLVRRLLAQVPDLARLRLSSLDPAEIDDDLWRLIEGEARLMPHLHLSVQAGCDLILKRMKRRHARADVVAVAARARALRPDIVLGADLIAGFPTETDAHFAETLDLVATAGLSYLHVFPYSPRPGTPAARMRAVPGDVARARAATLRQAGLAARDRFFAGLLGRIEAVLMERGGIGRTRHYAPVRPDGHAAPGTLVQVRLKSLDDGILQGELV
jgi:threonylcarbamoyladenosine tRNA methylthiotransferase MtaB